MKFTLPITLLASAFLATNVEARWQPHASDHLTWDYLLGASDSVIKSSEAQVVTIDLEAAERLVPYLHNKGQRAICYFSGGTFESSRTYDYQDYLNAGIKIDEKSPWGNYYIDIRKKSKLQPLIRKRMQRAHKYKCDAVEVDSLGVYGHIPDIITKDDCYVFAKWVAETGHEEGISVGMKNLPALADKLSSTFDFVVNESCGMFNECGYYKSFLSKNKAVFNIHYTSHRDYNASKIRKNLTGYNFSCVIAHDNKLRTHNTNVDCVTGAKRGPGSKQKITPESETVKKTTTVAKKTTTTIKKIVTTKSVTPIKPTSSVKVSTAKQVNPANLTPLTGVKPAGNQDSATKQPILSNINPGNATNAINVNQPGVAPNAQNANQPVNATNKDVSNKPANVVNTIDNAVDEENGAPLGAAVAVVGGIATAAVAGFVFLKKNKKFSVDDEISLGY